MTTFRFAISLVLLLFSLCAQAKGRDDEFQQHFKQGMSYYDSQRFLEAIEEFQAAYGIRSLPRLLFLIGQSYRKYGAAAKAVEAFEGYLRTDSKVPAAGRLQVEAYIAQLKQALAEQERLKARQSETKTPALDLKPAQPPPPPAVVVVELPKTEVALARKAPAVSPFYRRRWFWITVSSVAAVGAATAVVVATHPWDPDPGVVRSLAGKF